MGVRLSTQLPIIKNHMTGMRYYSGLIVDLILLQSG